MKFRAKMTAIFNDIFVNHWVYSSLVSLGTAFAVCWIYDCVNSRSLAPRTMILAYIGATILIDVGIYAGYRTLKDWANPNASNVSAAFFVTKTWQNWSGPSTPFGWFVSEYHPGLKRVERFDGASMVELTNLRPIPMMIASYLIVVQLPSGQWVAVETCRLGSPGNGKTYVGDDPKKVRGIKYQTFDAAIENKSIGPNETIRGWVIFKDWPMGSLRFELRDMTGTLSAEPFSPSIAQDFSPEGGAARPTQPVNAELSDRFEDISGLPLVPTTKPSTESTSKPQ